MMRGMGERNVCSLRGRHSMVSLEKKSSICCFSVMCVLLDVLNMDVVLAP